MANTAMLRLLAMRDRPIALQQFFEIRQRVQTRQAVVADRDGRRLMRAAQASPCASFRIDAQALAGVAVMARQNA